MTASNHRVTSPATPTYNCIAWAAEDAEHWWEPGIFWIPGDSAPDVGLKALERAFSALQYVNCEMDVGLETGFEKVAVYGLGAEYTHAARQLSSGKWTSKLGKAEDIEHDSPDAVAGGLYGEVVQIMKRHLARS